MAFRLLDKRGGVFSKALSHAVAGGAVALDFKFHFAGPKFRATWQRLEPIQFNGELLSQVSGPVSKSLDLIKGHEERLTECLAKAPITFESLPSHRDQFRDGLQLSRRRFEMEGNHSSRLHYLKDTAPLSFCENRGEQTGLIVRYAY